MVCKYLKCNSSSVECIVVDISYPDEERGTRLQR